MAYVVETATTTGSGSGAVTIAIGTPAQNDLILIFCAVGGSATMSTPSGYTLLYTSTNTVRQYCWYKIAGASESAPTSTPGFSSNGAIVTVIVRDVDTTTPITNSSGVGYNSSTFTNVKEVAAPQITTGAAKTQNLVIHAGSILNDSIVSDFSKTTALAVSTGGGTLFVAKEWVEDASTASTAFTWLTNQSTSRTGNLGVVSINNKSGGLRDISCLMTNTRLVKPYPYGTGETLSAPNVILTGATPLASLGVYGTAAATGGNGALAGSYLTSLNINTGTNIGASDLWVGFSFPTTATLNMTGKIVGFAWNPTQPWSAATTNTNGVAIVFSDNVGAWVAYQVRTLSTAYLNTDHIKYISPGVTTPLGSSGTIDWTSITNITWLYARKASQTNTPIVTMHSAYLFDGVSTLVGGSATKPITASQIYKSVTQYIEGTGTVGLASFGAFQGSGQVLGYAPLQLGNGSVPTYVKLATNSYETPPSSTRLSDYYVTNASYGITLYGSSTCTFDLRSALIASTSLQQFTIHASSSLSASMLTTGASFIGRTFSDLAGYTWTSVSWSAGDTVTIGGGGDLVNCTVNQTVSTNAALAITANGSTLDGCTIDGTGADYALELADGVTAITITDCTLTAGSTDKVHVLDANGAHTVTITISGTTSLAAGDVTSAGATVVISAPLLYQTVTVSGATAGSRIQIYDTTSSTELYNGTPAFPYTWTDSAAAAADRAIRLRVSYVSGATAKDFIEANIGTCGQTSGTAAVSYLVNQVADVTYNSNAIDGPAIYATSGITFTDAATDRVNCNIGGGSVTYKTIYACFVYWNFTATGIANDFTYISAPDTANYILSGMKIRNTSATDLSVTGGYGRDATSGASVDIIDTAGSTGNIFLAPDHVVAYATGSGVTAQDITDIAAATAAAVPSASTIATTTVGTAIDGTTTLAESIRLHNSVLAGKVSGAGTGTETFRDLADTKDRVVATVDTDGNRTAITRDAT